MKFVNCRGAAIVVLAVAVTQASAGTDPYAAGPPLGLRGTIVPEVMVDVPEIPIQPVVVRLHFHDTDHLNAVAGELDIWEDHPDGSHVVAMVTPEQYRWLIDIGYRLEIDADKTAALGTRAALDPRFHYYDDFLLNANGLYVVDFLFDTNADWPQLTELYDIGDAWMAAQPGEHDRDIWVLRITNEDPTYGAIDQKPAFFLFANIHAREVATPELAIRYIKFLTDGYDNRGGFGIDPDVTWLVNHHVVYVLVMQNPDGHWMNEVNTSNLRRKNMDWDDGCDFQYYWGVDLNRNHSFLWGCCGGSSGDPCNGQYRGQAPASEPEIQAFQSFFASVMQDQNGPNGDNEIPPAAPDDTTGVFVSLHSYSDIVFWPWAFGGYGDPPNYDQLVTIGRKFAFFNGYDPSGSLSYIMDGASDDWAYGKFGIASFTIEVGPQNGPCGGFFPPFDCIDGINGAERNFWAENRPVLLYAHKIAGSPYLTAYGPDAVEVIATPATVEPGMPAILTATIADQRYGLDPLIDVAAAEFFVDQPEVGGFGSALTPVDGAWDAPAEQAVGVVDTSGLTPGRHYILVHGQSAAGFWGPYTAAFLDVCDAGDLDCNGAIDLADFAWLEACLAGPDVAIPPAGCEPAQFDRSDLDGDTDVDVGDFAVWQTMR